MLPTNPQQYLLVELSHRKENITLALDTSNLYILGCQPRQNDHSFKDVHIDVLNALFLNIQRESLHFEGKYGSHLKLLQK